MPRKSKSRKAYPQASITNQDLIEQCVVQFNMVGSDSNQKILEMLLTQPRNLDCIVNDKKRAEVATKYGWDEPTDAERVEYCLDQSKKSTAKSKGGQLWASMVEDGELSDRKAYHELRLQRLKEQIRQKKKKLEGDMERRAKMAAAVEETGEADTINWEDAEDEPIRRIPTFHPSIDPWFGKSVDKIVMPSGKERTVTSYGMAAGFSYAFGAPKGMGKTRWLVKLLGELCGPVVTREDGVSYGGGRGLYVQGEETMGMFRSLFLRDNWQPGEVDVQFSQATTLDKIEEIMRREEPDFVVIDSKDMVYEFTGNDQRVRDGVMRFNAILTDIDATAFIVSHIAKSTGDIKGSSMFSHMCRAVMLGEIDEHMKGAFNLYFDKNRGGRTREPLRFRHTERSVELDEKKVIKSKDKPDLTIARGSTGNLTDAITRAIESASGNTAPRQIDQN